MDLAVALGAVTAGLTVTIDGRVYRPIAVNASGQLVIVGSGAGGALTVSATDLDIRNLTKALDELYAVLRTDAGVAYDARDRSWTVTETVPVSQTTPDNLRAGVHGRYAGSWQRQPLVFGFSGQYNETVTVALAVAGTNALTFTAVPANTLRVITNFWARDETSVCTAIDFRYFVGAAGHRLRVAAAPGIVAGADWAGPAYLLPGDQPQALFTGCVLNDVLRAVVVGYDMTLNL